MEKLTGKLDVGFLEGVAKRMGVTTVPRDVRNASRLVAQGIPVPGYEGQDSQRPVEEFLLKEILVTAKSAGDVPPGVVEYMRNRGFIVPSTTVGTVVRQEQRRTLGKIRGLVNGVLKASQTSS